MANRVSESAPAPAPAPVASEPAAPASTRSPAAQKMGIPDFSQESPAGEPVALAWNDYDAEDGGGMPTGDRSTVNMEGTNAEGAGRPRRVAGKNTINVVGTDAEVDPDIHLDASSAEGDPVEVAAEPAKPVGSERRRMALAALEREQNNRAIETNLIAERSKREALEQKLKTATLGELLAARGMNRDDALEALIAGKEGATEEEKLTPEQRREAQLLADIDALKKDKTERERREARLEYENAQSRVADIAREVESAPVVAAAIKHNKVVDFDEKTGQALRATEWIAGLAEAEWTKAGRPAGKQKDYVRAATEVLEDFLVEQNDPLVKAVMAKRSGSAAREVPTTAARPPSLRRPAARPDARPAPLPRDRDQLDIELKRRFNLR